MVDPPAPPRLLMRAASDTKVAGVCGGLARYLGVEAQLVRIAAVLLLFFVGLPVLLAYGLAAIALPGSDGPDPNLRLDWQADGMRVRWSGVTVPHALPWVPFLVGVGSVGFALGGLIAVFTALSMAMDTNVFAPMLALTGVMASMYAPAALAAVVMGALFPRPWAVTLSHDAIWIERPLRDARRLHLARVEGVQVDRATFDLRLDDGELIRLPRPPEGEAWDALLHELRQSRGRAADHQADLASAEAERSRLERMMRQRGRES